MTYRVRCKRATRTRELRRDTRQPCGVSASEFTDMLKAFYGSKGAYEAPSPGFTPNENWEPRYRPGIKDVLYAEPPFLKMFPTRAECDAAHEPGATSGRHTQADPPLGFRVSIEGHWRGESGGEE